MKVRPSFAIRAVTVGVATAITVGTVATATHAAPSEAVTISTAIANATAGMETPIASGQVDVPATSADPVRLGEVEIGLPGPVTTAIQTSAGTSVYPSSGAADVAVQTLADGSVRALVAIADASAPTEYRFPMTLPAGARLQSMPDGAVVIANDEAIIGVVAAPWATDANGKAVATRYRLDGNTLIQEVDHRGAAYPVVADPDVSLGWFIYVRFSKSEVNMIPDTALMVGGGALAAYLCPKIPNAVAKAACGAVATAYLGSVVGTLRDAKKAGQCVEFRYNYAPQLLVGWRRYNC